MSIFRCDKCGCIENTATSMYWIRPVDKETNKFTGPALCSECDPVSESGMVGFQRSLLMVWFWRVTDSYMQKSIQKVTLLSGEWSIRG